MSHSNKNLNLCADSEGTPGKLPASKIVPRALSGRLVLLILS